MYKDLVFARGEFLTLVGAQSNSLRLIIIYYIKIHILDKHNFAIFTSEPKKPLSASILEELVIMTLFKREVNF